MATARKCDICNAYYDYDYGAAQNGFCFAKKDIYSNVKHFAVLDCCPKCLDAIQNCISDLQTDNAK